MSEPFIGEIRAVGFNFAPRGWATCSGQLLSIAQNTALFSLLGTTYGGDGVTTFALPDYRGRGPVGTGTGPGLSAIAWGQMAGVENVSMTSAQMPAHTHMAAATQMASDQPAATLASPAGAVAAPTVSEDGGRTPFFSFDVAANGKTPMAPIAVTVQPAGGNQPLPLRNPYLGTNFIIATEGIFPSRP